MSELNHMQLRRLDLTVLLIFLGLMQQRKAAAVAQDLGLSNSAISHALRRLRDLFGDPLFLRQPHGLEPTAFALGIEPDIRAAVAALDATLAGPATFDPAQSTAHLRLSAPDHALDTLVADLLDACARAAPGITWSVRCLGRSDAMAGLAEGQLDLALGFFWDLPERLMGRHLGREGYLMAARADHPLMQGECTIDAYCAASHLLVAQDGSMRGIVDQRLEAIGRSRRVGLSLPLFLPALSVLRRSDYIATLPARLVLRHAARFGLSHRPVPLEIRPFDMTAVWHRRDEKNPLTLWLLERLAEQTA